MKNQFGIFLVLCMLLALSLAACSPRAAAQEELLVFAASSLTDAFEQIGTAYEQAHPGVDVLFNFGSSSTLAAQLIEGAAADIYASANPAQMQNVLAAALIAEQPQLFATNRLTIIVPADNPASLHSPQDLAHADIALVLAAPGVPIREYSDQAIAMLGGADFQAAVYANLVSEEENVRVVVTKVSLGEADAGIVYTSDLTPEVSAKIQQIEIPDAANVIAAYPIAPLADAPSPELAADFIAFVLSAEGQRVLSQWGFGPQPE